MRKAVSEVGYIGFHTYPGLRMIAKCLKGDPDYVINLRDDTFDLLEEVIEKSKDRRMLKALVKSIACRLHGQQSAFYLMGVIAGYCGAKIEAETSKTAAKPLRP